VIPGDRPVAELLRANRAHHGISGRRIGSVPEPFAQVRQRRLVHVAAVIVAGEWLGLMLNPAAPALRVRVLLHIAGVLVRGCRSRVTRRRGLRLSSGPRLASPLPRATRKWWGEATSTASDSKRFASWDSNLMTEFHARCGGCGVMIYWHVERGRLCVYSQLKSCSSSEADAVETAGLWACGQGSGGRSA